MDFTGGQGQLTHAERQFIRMSKMVGWPGGIEAWQRSRQAGAGLVRSAGASAWGAAAQASEPLRWGAANVVGLEAYGGMSGGKVAAFNPSQSKGWTWLGFNFERQQGNSFAKWMTRKSNAPFKYAGFSPTAAGALPIIGSIIGIGFTAHEVTKGFEKNGLVGAFTAGARETMLASAMWGIPRAVGPFYPIIASNAVSAMHVGSLMMKDYQAAQQRRLPLRTTGNMQAYTTQAASTMRERSLRAIQKSHLNARSAIGNEAQYAHYSGRRI